MHRNNTKTAPERLWFVVLTVGVSKATHITTTTSTSTSANDKNGVLHLSTDDVRLACRVPTHHYASDGHPRTSEGQLQP